MCIVFEKLWPTCLKFFEYDAPFEEFSKPKSIGKPGGTKPMKSHEDENMCLLTTYPRSFDESEKNVQ